MSIELKKADVIPLAKILHGYCLKYDWDITQGDCEITARNIIKAMDTWGKKE